METPLLLSTAQALVLLWTTPFYRNSQNPLYTILETQNFSSLHKFSRYSITLICFFFRFSLMVDVMLEDLFRIHLQWSVWRKEVFIQDFMVCGQWPLTFQLSCTLRRQTDPRHDVSTSLLDWCQRAKFYFTFSQDFSFRILQNFTCKLQPGLYMCFLEPPSMRYRMHSMCYRVFIIVFLVTMLTRLRLWTPPV